MKIIHRLENILAEYEDLLWFLRLLMVKNGDRVNHIPQPELLRKALAERDAKASMQICSDLFDAGDGFKFSFDCASDLADWCTHSKRIFSLSDGLCQMLMQTELPDFSAEHLKFVSQAYIIRLQKPIICKNGRVHDFILCSYSPATRLLSVRSYPISYEEYRALTPEKKCLVEKDARRGNERFEEFSEKQTRNSKKRLVIGYSCFLSDKKTLRQAILETVPPDEKEEWELLLQLALGVNLYLQTARGDDTAVVHQVGHPVTKNGRPKPITGGTQLFELATSSAFVAPKESHGGGSDAKPEGSVRPHFRRGYWRRPSGSGNDPDAPAIIWVRPTWVRMDKILEGVQPVGTSQTVKIVE